MLVNEELYRIIVNKMIEARKDDEEFIDDNDFVVMMYLFTILNDKEPIELKSKRIAENICLEKQEVKESIGRLIDLEILREFNETFKFGYTLNTNLYDNKEIKK